ncbi:MAG: ATP synthase subunit I [Proteobacteria bacterium]|nr:ATP synthase subunit I [Desulfobacula sp.]MBU3951664.1 ATP synthase subunit I [Pseudomonadota bacterium]MBU4132027.1 ATP synthase subunit I [Pseudomonadota bacterium]
MQDLQKIVNFVTKTNWLLFMGSSLLALMTTPTKVSLGVLLGGLIVAVNFQLLKKTIVNNLSPEVVSVKGRSLVGNVLVKYYIRFVISGGLIFLLISNHIVHPLGLLAGLSVVVASMFLATLLELTRLFFKEAV